MKKFSEFIGGVREAEEAKKSELQKSYQDYFQAKLSKFGVESPADLDEEKKKEFFNEISADWDAGKGVKASAEKKVEKEKEEAGIKEAELPAAPAAQEVGKEVPAAPDAEEGDKEVPAAAEPKEEEAPAIEVNVEGAIDTEKEVK
jgi:mannitol-specific phosphotransferase system IIBC component